MRLKGKICVITGAASGIGHATALAAASRGAPVVLTDRAPVDATAAAVRERGGEVLATGQVDVTDHEAVAAFAETVHADHGSVDVVMNVAGVSTWGAIEQLAHSDWQQMVAVNLMGPISVLEAFVPSMIAAGRGGHIVNVSSAAGLLGLPWHAAYSASKFGLRGVSEVLRFDLARYGIGVALVCPGAVDTPLVGTVRIVGIDRDHPAARRTSADFSKHAVSPEDVASKLLDGVEHDRYLVFTSRDIHAAHLLQRFLPRAYEFAMKRLNDQLFRVGQQARA